MLPLLDSSVAYSKRKIATPASPSDTLLTESDKEIYGDWEPHGYWKISLLGKGGAAVVWLGKRIATGEKVALKQFPKKGDTSTVKLEIEIADRIFGSGLKEADFPGLKHISALLD